MSLLAANSIAIAFFSAPDSTDDSGAITPASASAVEPETFAGVASDASATPEAVPTTRAQARINRPAFILPPWACHRGFPSGRRVEPVEHVNANWKASSPGLGLLRGAAVLPRGVKRFRRGAEPRADTAVVLCM